MSKERTCDSCKNYGKWDECKNCYICPCYGCNCEYPYQESEYMPNYGKSEVEE